MNTNMVALDLVVNVAGGISFIVAGAVLLAVRPARRGVPAFALFAVASGAQQVMSNLPAFPGDGLRHPLLAITGPLLVLAVSNYVGRSLAWPVVFLLPMAVGSAAVILAPTLMLTRSGALTDPGHFLWSMPRFIAFALASLFLAEHYARVTGALRIETFLLLAAIAPFLAYTAGLSAPVFWINRALFDEPLLWGYLAVFAFCLASIVRVGSRLWSQTSAGGRILAAVSLGVAAAGWYQAVGTGGAMTQFGGILRVISALLLGYGLLKYGLFDVDLKLKWSLDRGTILALFGGVFFLVEEIAANFVSAALGTIAGFAAAAILLLAFKPLRRATQRLADRVFPHVSNSPESVESRKLVVYRSAAEAAAKDGVITERERDMLAALVRELRIASADVARVEHEVLGGSVA